MATEFRAWFYPPVPGKNGGPPRNAGKICFYCGRLHNIRYSVTFKDTKSWVLTLIPESKAMKLFKERLDNLIKFFIAKGSRYVAYEGAGLEETVRTNDYEEEGWSEPDDDYWEWEEYVADFGDPRSNGKGHQVTERWNRREKKWETCVVVPGRKIYKYKRRAMKKAEHIKVIDRGQLQLGPTHMSERMQEMAATFGDGLPTATGVRLSSYIFGQATSASSSRALPGTTLQVSPQKQGNEKNSLTPAKEDERDLDSSGEEEVGDMEVAPASGINFGVRSLKQVVPSSAVEPVVVPDEEHKSKAKAKCKSKRSGPSGQSHQLGNKEVPNKIGAPKKDPFTRAQSIEMGFRTADAENEHWFGGNHKNWIRTCKRVLLDVQALSKNEEDQTVRANMHLACKAVGLCIRMAEAIKQHTLASPETLKVYDTLTRECQTAPLVQQPFPPFIMRQMHDSSSQQAWPPSAFWQIIKATTLRTIFGGGDLVTKEKQIALVLDKITAASQLETMTACCDVILALFAEDELDKLSADELEITVRVACVELRLVAACEASPVRESKRVLQDACTKAMAIDNDFGTALTTFRSGREVLVRAQDMCRKLGEAEAELDKFQDIMAALVQSEEQRDLILAGLLADKGDSSTLGNFGPPLKSLQEHMRSMSDLCMKDCNHTIYHKNYSRLPKCSLD